MLGKKCKYVATLHCLNTIGWATARASNL